MVHFFLFFFKSVLSLQNLPIINASSCNGYYNTYSYACQTGSFSDPTIQKPFIHLNAKNPTFVPDQYPCYPNESSFNHYCYPTSDYVGGTYFSQGIHYFDAIQNGNIISTDPTVSISSDNEFYQKLNIARQLCPYLKSSSLPSNSACQMIANAWALSCYYPLGEIYDLYTSVFPDRTGNLYEINGWPYNAPFLQYPTTLSAFLDESYITSTYSYKTILNFQLARFNWTGEFIDFKTITIDLNKCGIPAKSEAVWRQFGTNFYSECYFNLTNELFDSNPESRYLYELFLLETDQATLRPIQILIKNYRESSTEKTNAEENPKTSKLFRRFFLLDDYTSKTKSNDNYIIQYAKNITLIIRMQESNRTYILPPYMILEYGRITKTAITNQDTSTVILDKETTSTPLFSFSVLYTMDYSKKWNQMIIVISVFGAIGTFLWLILSFSFARLHADDGIDGIVIIGIIANLFNIAGTVIYICTAGFSIYVYIFFKWATEPYLCLPPESEFKLLIPLIWLVFGCKFIALILFTFLNLSNDIFLIDWENSKKENYPVSAWRRIRIANEYCKIQTTRSYYLPFILILILFIEEGLNAQLLSSPIPQSKLIDTGKSYKILRFALTSIIWLISILLETFLIRGLRFIFGNPLVNFLDLCSTSNISILILTSRSTGFYLHGRSPHTSSDETMQTLTDHLRQETSNRIGFRGLGDNSVDQVFSIYLNDPLRSGFGEAYDLALYNYTKKAVKEGMRKTGDTCVKAAYAAYDNLNNFWRLFLDQAGENVPKLIIQNSSILERLLGIPPAMNNDTNVFTIRKLESYFRIFLTGIEWILMMTDLTLFHALEIATESPAIAAFIVFVFDSLYTRLYSKWGKNNVAKKSLLDIHFLMK